MLQHCALCRKTFDDGKEIKDYEEWSQILKRHESVACKDCWEKLTETANKIIIKKR